VRYLVLGAIDGIITAGTLSASLILRGGAVDMQLALSLSVLVASINALTVFVAEFSHQMKEVRKLAYKLSLREERVGWTLIHSRALYATLRSALSNFTASFLGAASVLIPACYAPHAALLAIAAAVVAASYLLAGGSWAEFLEFAAMASLAIALGLLIGLAFPVIT
jgi:VIT1/CCC1 family predicted Fe2+/Mn2+ transporter